MTRAALYARVSTTGQHVENQLPDLRRYARERGWAVRGEYMDEGVSGSRNRRPALDEMMNMARKRKLDAILVWRFDRFARSVRHLVLTLEELNNLDVAFVSYQENIDTATPAGKAMFTIISAMAELERNILIERTRAGLAQARRRGKRLGRPPLGTAALEEMLELKRQGHAQYEIAERLGVSRAFVSRAIHPPTK